jgi:hypothetical protein
MSQSVRLESGWLSKQLISAQERASLLPNWKTRPTAPQQQSQSTSSNLDNKLQPDRIKKSGE